MILRLKDPDSAKRFKVRCTRPVKGKWLALGRGRLCIGIRHREGWHLTPLRSPIKSPVSICCVPNSHVEIIGPANPPQAVPSVRRRTA